MEIDTEWGSSAEPRREGDENSATGLGSRRLAMEGKEFSRSRGGISAGMGRKSTRGGGWISGRP